MNPHIELIWNKIDGTLNKEDQKMFDNLLKTDKSFASLYQKHTELERVLRKNPSVQKAPDSLLANVMQQVQLNPSFVKKDVSFSGFKTIGLVLALSTLIVTLVVVLNSSKLSVDGSYAAIGDYLNQFQSSLKVPAGLMHYLPYSMALLAGIGLVWLDNYYRQSHNNFRTA